jgi:hypothetical protein
MRIHKNRYHKPHDDPFHFVQGTVCEHCRISYGNRDKLIIHLKTAKHCWKALRPSLTRLPPSQLDELRAQTAAQSKANTDRGLYRVHSDQPTFKLTDEEWLTYLNQQLQQLLHHNTLLADDLQANRATARTRQQTTQTQHTANLAPLSTIPKDAPNAQTSTTPTPAPTNSNIDLGGHQNEHYRHERSHGKQNTRGVGQPASALATPTSQRPYDTGPPIPTSIAHSHRVTAEEDDDSGECAQGPTGSPTTATTGFSKHGIRDIRVAGGGASNSMAMDRRVLCPFGVRLRSQRRRAISTATDTSGNHEHNGDTSIRNVQITTATDHEGMGVEDDEPPLPYVDEPHAPRPRICPLLRGLQRGTMYFLHFFLAKDAGGTHNFGWKSGSLQCSWTW